MKIVNICLAGSYNYGWGYQDNLITKYQQELGNDVTIITSRFINEKNGEGYIEVAKETKYDGLVKVIRLDHFINKKITYYFRKYKGLYNALEEEKPDFIFIHCCQFLDVFNVCKYIKKHPKTYVCVDNHADYTNSAKGLFARLIHKTLWRTTARAIDRYASVFFGVIPIRCDFLHDMYGISNDKIDLLVMGADDEKVEKSKANRSNIREQIGIDGNTKLIITGGKIDSHKKGILNLMNVVNELNNNDIKLIVFGSVVPELKSKFDKLLSEKVNYIGWINQDDIYDYLCASDIAIFPSRHSVIWEQVVGCGLPSIFLRLPKTDHVDVNGNCLFLENDTEEEIREVLLRVINNVDEFTKLKTKSKIASSKFSYNEIAKYSIEETIRRKILK